MAPDPYTALKELKFGDWEDLYQNDDLSRPAKIAVLDIMMHTATTLFDWMGIHGYYDHYSKRKANVAVCNAMQLAKDFDDWFEIAVTTRPFTRAHARCIAELETRAQSFKQLLKLAHLLLTNAFPKVAAAPRRRVLAVLMRRAKTFKQWFEVWCETEKFDPAVREEARKRLDAVATSPEQQAEIGKHEWVLAETQRRLEAIRAERTSGEN